MTRCWLDGAGEGGLSSICGDAFEVWLIFALGGVTGARLSEILSSGSSYGVMVVQLLK